MVGLIGAMVAAIAAFSHRIEDRHVRGRPARNLSIVGVKSMSHGDGASDMLSRSLYYV